MALIQRDVERLNRQSLVFLLATIFLTTVGDVIYAHYYIHGTKLLSPGVNLLWLASATAFLGAATWQIGSEEKATYIGGYNPPPYLLRLLLPYVAAAVGPVLLIIVINSTTYNAPGLQELLIGTIGLIGLVLMRQYAVLAENVRLYREMQRLAITDSLTGVYNRHFFIQTLQREVGRSRRYGKPMSILLVDADDFKKFNDALGHLQGDLVLKMMANVLAGQLRKVDVLARFGGDEFIIILPETDRNGAKIVSEKIQKAIEAQTYAEMSLGVSVGVATYHLNSSPEQLIEEADHDLYHQKAIREPASQALTRPEAHLRADDLLE